MCAEVCSSFAQKVPADFNLSTIIRGFVNRGQSMHQPEMRANAIGKVTRPMKEWNASWRVIEGANDIAKSIRNLGRVIVVMHSGENWALCIVKYFCCYGSDEKDTIATLISRHNNQIGIVVLGARYDPASWVTVDHYGLVRCLCYFFRDKVLKTIGVFIISNM
jgi:hypothetical protein